MRTFLFIAASATLLACVSPKIKRNQIQSFQREPYRLQFHFSPKEKWMNDPNGMVFYNNIYHLFYQYNPNSTVWGPMHWGHATSSDLVHWKHQPIALYPDSLGTIFSGSAVVDWQNTSGFGREGKVPLVAIYTNHDHVGEKAKRSDFQVQSIAYSLDEGATWTKYNNNPILLNPGIKDFRDPKVIWHEVSRRWIMALATKDRVSFYSAPDLKNWTKESEFGERLGAHGGVWECPDLFPLNHRGQELWVLLVSINPGGPNGGSATQYFVGNFDGKKFSAIDTTTKWIDYGPDNYAGVTWSNTGARKVFLGWMSNWEYAANVPTQAWRSSMTIPRELSLEKIDGQYLLRSLPVRELATISSKTRSVQGLHINGKQDLTSSVRSFSLPAQISFATDNLKDFSLVLSNSAGEQLEIGYNSTNNHYFIDRSKSGKTDFHKSFARKIIAPRLVNTKAATIDLWIDVGSVEVFTDGGTSLSTSLFFPSAPYDQISIEGTLTIRNFSNTPIRSVWK